MHRLKQSFNDLKMRNKFLIIYFITVLVPILISNTVFFSQMTTNFIEQKREDTELITEQTSEEFKQLIDQAIGLSTSLYLDVRLYEFFNYEYPNLVEYIQEYNAVINQYRKTVPLYNAIEDIRFYTTNPSMLYAGGIHQLATTGEAHDWYNQLNATSLPTLIERKDEAGVQLAIYRPLDYFTLYTDFQNIVNINLNPRAVNNVLNNAAVQGNIYLLNDKQDILFSTNGQETEDQTVFVADEYDRDTYHVSEHIFQDDYLQGWSVVTVVDESIYTKELFESARFIILISIMNFILPGLLIVYISKSFHTRLINILDHTKKIAKKNFAEYPHVKSKDEIGQLANQINRMTRKINQLFNEVFKANLEKKDLELREKEAQLSALQSQINPHFLFNALETIRMRSLIKNEDETAAIIENMAGIFRNSLAWGRNWVTVNDEVRLIHAFLEIQAYRFGDKLKYRINVEEDLFNFEIPNLAFLPFVENASIHGVEPLKANGKITVNITKTAMGLRFVVEDNGVGIAESTLTAIISQMENQEEMGNQIGIQNAYYRLKLYYKDRFRFKIESEEGIGTTVTIDLPAQDSILEPYLKKIDKQTFTEEQNND